MRRRLIKKLSDLLVQSKKPRWSGESPPLPQPSPSGGSERAWEPAELKQTPVSPDLAVNLRFLRALMGSNTDFVVREFKVAGKVPGALAFLSGMVERAQLNYHILERLMLDYPEGVPVSIGMVKDRVTTVAELEDCKDFWKAAEAILAGKAVLFLAGETQALVLDTRGYETRSIGDPEIESVVRGPRDAFVEDVERNIMLIRRRLKTPNLVVERFNLGRLTQSVVVLLYIKGLVAPELVAEVRSRVKRINMDAVFSCHYVEEMVADSPHSFFPQTIATERPDRVAAALAEGKLACLTDTAPMALIVPATLAALLQSPEDYYHPYVISTAIRWLRYLAFFISVTASPLYIAITTFHQEMIPFRLLLSVAAAREGVPLPAVLEALVMELTFELLREAGIRFPRPIGQAVSIVGALVIGEAAVTAGVVSPLMVIIVALAGIASFATPSYELAIPMRLFRFPLMVLAGSLGLFGLTAGLLALLIHLAGLRSFGVPYLTPVAPLKFPDLKDVLVRVPLWMMRTRPETAKRNWYRMPPGLKPGPPPEE
ncbi:spore germination protein [Thermodesulfitimonas autotrophica]|uniref:spore germination protein n=1 Tax=Thermodesulfitimonas autotrophica TaxID=1894989 RepID=UPI002FE33A8B